jgi:hypothetical protein
LNGEQKVTEVGTGYVKFATAASNGTASGTITFKMAPMGWTKAFVGTNLAAYKSANVESTGMYLRVDDTGTTTARVVGYESMSGISTGTGPFPTATQMSGGGYWNKSVAATSSRVIYTVTGDSRAFFFHASIYTATASSDNRTNGSLHGFGDMVALRASGDAYACVLSYRPSVDLTNNSQMGSFDHGANAVMAMPRNYSGLGSAILTASYAYVGSSASSSGMDSTLGVFPSVVDGSLRLSRRFLSNDSSSDKTPRVDVPGIYTVPQSNIAGTFSHWNTAPGTGQVAGRNLIAVTTSPASFSTAPAAGSTGITFIDITGPWR